jgi:hypothetical protein
VKYRTLAVVVMLACAVVLLILGRRQVSLEQQQESDRMHQGEWLGRGVHPPQAEILRSLEPLEADELQAVHPPQGAVYPKSFPPPRIMWKNREDGLIYRVELRRGEAPAFVAVTTRLEVRPQEEAWKAIKQGAGPVTIRIRSARIEPQGRIIGSLYEGPETVPQSFPAAPCR